MSNNTNGKPISIDEIREGEINTHVVHISQEFRDGFELMKKFPKSVSIFGSSQAKRDSQSYKQAYELSGRIAKELQYAVVSGGGPGIMEAANKGAFDAKGISIGLDISLPHERTHNPFVTSDMKFSYFFVRKTMLTFAAEAYVFFPGGFGTFDEFFSIVTLMQTGKIPRVPIALVGSEFWRPIIEVLRKEMSQDYKTISDEDLKMFEITDSVDRVIELIKKAPISEWWRIIN